MIIRNARIVGPDQEFLGSMGVTGPMIAELDSGAAMQTGEDWQGDYLVPGLVELHTDNLEKHLMPRPKVRWPVLPAIMAHDAQVAAAGITTVLDAVAIGDIDADSLRNDLYAACVAGLALAAKHDVLKAEHFLHVRLELVQENLLSMFSPMLDNERLKLVSLMDHTPGQRQWSDIAHFRTYVSGKRGWSAEKVELMLDNLRERQQRFSSANRRAIVAACQQRATPVPLATHDDTTVAHVEEGVADGVIVSEFPTTEAAARAARQHGLGIIMGAPNMVRGGSHSGNIGAADLARAGLLDVLSSDYVPASLLHAAFLLREVGFTLPQAMATVSHNPARMIGLTDRGQIIPGQRADFLRVRLFEGIPVVLNVWRAGRQVA